MGAVKRVLITGASGFIGRATVDAALDAGLEVVAVQRRVGADRTDVTYVSVDLTVRDSVETLSSAMAGCDAVIHLAAAMSGDPTDHARLTLAGTEHVIAAMKNAGIGHLTLASSLAVYDTSTVAIGAVLTDTTPLVTTDTPRDAYSDAKAQQETLVSNAGFDSVTVVRPGIVYDADHLWNAHLGVGAGPALFRAAADDPLPMCHVQRCAAALVKGTLKQVHDTITLVDRNLPARGQVIAKLQESGWPKQILPLPTGLLWTTARMLGPVSSKLPGLLRAPVLRQRLLPMTYRFHPPEELDLPDPSPAWEARL
ncbi:NAD(P)-dependent oxidoreductase [Marivita sp. XM-24bin2]|jgi:nucleoside-diphosphate-sugar epimerase|uniref:NAD-dependent epimerase/dehydratase family protein n=1 Tax=unclassified Marivita TaxID=2632480 RepID=UPI000D7AE154|nr:NAD(P)-dependent oxidoreductase [Marivita sp. XM-24bin2]MCR9108307.1 NAD(P)-dependent oxidoreductase [Paracoccaceae bacterium]PWL36267.1 MAG: epimerase [Marivita sp. XM-24bin2]